MAYNPYVRRIIPFHEAPHHSIPRSYSLKTRAMYNFRSDDEETMRTRFVKKQQLAGDHTT